MPRCGRVDLENDGEIIKFRLESLGGRYGTNKTWADLTPPVRRKWKMRYHYSE